jgi:Ca2+-binding RTX toxin-like protein
MYSHLASNDSTEPLSFVSGWMVNTTVALVGGGYANYGTDDGKDWIDLETNAGLIRLVGVEYTVHKGDAPASDASYFYWPVWPDKYLQVAKTAQIDRIFSHSHQTSFDNVYGGGSRPTVGEVIGKHPVDLLSEVTNTRIDGTKFADTIVLNDAGGTVYSNGGADSVTGGDGGDLMFGGGGNDWLYGAFGRDNLNGDNGNDRLYGGGDNDELTGGAGKDQLHGDDAEDKLYGEWQNDRLYGEADRDWLYGGDNNDTVYGGSGEDLLYGGKDKDKLYGDIDNDYLSGGAHNDHLWGGVGQDELSGGSGNDRLYGDADNDPIHGGSGNDRAYGGIGQDTIHGDGGNDRLYGDADNDWLHGDKGNDLLDGGIANDFLYGEAGRDRLYGREDNDRLDGGGGNDVLSGGPGSDTFIFSTKLGTGNIDRITDFEVGSDGIWLSTSVFDMLPVGPLPAEYFHRGAKAADKDDYIVYDAKRGVLIYDKNGSGKGGEQVFAKLNKNTDLHNSDVYVKDPGELFI